MSLRANVPEYTRLFSNRGPVALKIKFSRSDKFRSMPDMRMGWDEMTKLIDPETGKMYRTLCFNGQSWSIRAYKIYPADDEIVLVVNCE